MKSIFFSALLGLSLLPGISQASWEIEPDHTHVSFEVGHLNLTKTPGIFTSFRAKVNFDDKNIEASQVNFEIDSKSIFTASEMRDKALRGENWLDSEKYPLITFNSISVNKVSENNYEIHGNLKIKDKTLPATFAVTLTNRIVNPWLHVPDVGFTGSTTIKRSDFGMHAFAEAISDQVILKISLELLQKP